MTGLMSPKPKNLHQKSYICNNGQHTDKYHYTSMEKGSGQDIMISIIPKTMAPPVPFQGWNWGTRKVAQKSTSDITTHVEIAESRTIRSIDGVEHQLTSTSTISKHTAVSYTEQEFDE